MTIPLKDNKAFLILASVTLAVRLLFSWLDMSFLLSRVVDDAFYYFKTAHYIVTEGISTFDGINLTNGYHPLWMLCILPVFFFTKGSAELSIHLVMTLQVILLGGILFLFGKILYSRFGSPFPLIGLSVLLWPRFLSQTEYGLEAGLLILFLLISSSYALNNRIFTSQQDNGKFIWFGIILALVFLARLDSVFYLLSAAIYILSGIFVRSMGTHSQLIKPGLFKKILLIFIPASLIPLPYLAWNYFTFGHLTPISGSLKHSFPVPTFNPDYVIQFSEFFIIVIIAFAFLAALFFNKNSISKFIPDEDYRAVLTVLALYVVIHFFDTIFFMKWAVFRWHFAGYTVFLILVLPVLTGIAESFLKNSFKISLPQSAKTSLLYVIVVSALVFQVFSIRRSIDNQLQYECYKEALWMKENTGKDDIFMLEDAGIIAYFSERKVINIDGVINNFELQDYLKRREFQKYIHDKKIKYFVHHAFWNNPEIRSGKYDNYIFTSFSHLYNVPGGTIKFKRSDEIYRSPEYDHFGEKTVLIIWKIPETT
ncbi:MAG: hypothetical protein HZA77_06965 [Candidatus Schekmanbacteria bacterium]|nr:hypothetical protein [Candidatus Schekmanbacteria bacterium]